MQSMNSHFTLKQSYFLSQCKILKILCRLLNLDIRYNEFADTLIECKEIL